MEKNSGSWFHQQHLHPPSTNLDLLLCPFDTRHTRHLNNEPVPWNPYFLDDSRSRNNPLFPVPGFQQSKASEPNNSSTRFCLMPHSHQAFTPALNSAFKENFHASAVDLSQQGTPHTGTTPSQRRFFVFDKAGDKTTLVFNSGIGTAVQCGKLRLPKPPTTYNLSKEGPRDRLYYLKPSMHYDSGEENPREVIEDEMHEDTEELDALLCSDSEDYSSEDDEEKSTGHSPSTMTNDGQRDLVEEIGEEVDSLSGPTKRQKLTGGSYDPPLHRNIVRKCASSALKDDMKYSCGNGNMPSTENRGSTLAGGKISRKDVIGEKLSILQSIIPNVNGKDPTVVIDEAIHYLKTLKDEAKAFGPDIL